MANAPIYNQEGWATAQAGRQVHGDATHAALFSDPQANFFSDKASRLIAGVPLDRLMRENTTAGYIGQTLVAAGQKKLSEMFPHLVGDPAGMIAGAAFTAGRMNIGGKPMGAGAGVAVGTEIMSQMGKRFFKDGMPAPGAHGFMQQDMGKLLAEM